MKKAGEEERQLAIQRDDFHHGVPAITVIVDGGWSKRSHKHSYNAKSGVGIITGKATNKLLHIGVRNKYCATCAKTDKKREESSQHNCFKNWDGASSSMETDIIVEGFKMAEERHGVRYIRFVGDGDSSVCPSLVAGVPIWGYAIQKIECANHATKCYRTALEKLTQDNPSYKGKGKLTEAMRKRLTKAARCAVKMRSAESDKRLAVQKLQHDLHNSPLHCFGIHDNCSKDFCKVAQQRASCSSENVIDPAHETGIATTTSEQAPSDDSDPSVQAILTISQHQQSAWNDVLDETDFDVVQSIPQAVAYPGFGGGGC